MRRYADHWLLVLLLLLVFPLPARAEETVQARIDEAPEYGVVRLASGVYDEAIVLSKPLALEGIGEVTIRSCRKSPVIAIYGRHVVLKNIRVVQCGDAPDMPAIYITGHDHTIDGVRVLTNQQGVKLDHAHHTTIVHCTVQGGKSGNGIDLWESTQNVIHYTAIERVKDGIYMENSHNNVLSGNHIYNARYGIHVMFSNRIVLRNNIFSGHFAADRWNGHTSRCFLADESKAIHFAHRIHAG
ncbi:MULTISPECIES: nitrous oxide reductase family maturation protein NosD [Geobacillus]|uniref:right-handed parallel beta-helix repeat-containing protein n=1 Tax=Geobacillus TaxID=129337 RepID=UPI000A5843C2|nr:MULTISPECIES: NosD domain-containing protein [Geobacillus]QNU25339.1 right-handed parallel beta-helix repeat-containing protein [Geobacillus zalihae]